MSDPLLTSNRLAASGLSAQSLRMQVVSENLANANSTSDKPGGAPYARKVLSFEAALDDASGASGVKVSQIGRDRTRFGSTHDPGHPAADASGNVTLPNVNTLIELADLREANRSYQANLEVIRQTRELTSLTIDLLRAPQ